MAQYGSIATPTFYTTSSPSQITTPISIHQQSSEQHEQPTKTNEHLGARPQFIKDEMGMVYLKLFKPQIAQILTD